MVQGWPKEAFSGDCGVTFGWLWGHVGGHFGHVEVPLGHLGSVWDYFGATLGALWGHFWVMKVALGDLEGASGSL